MRWNIIVECVGEDGKQSTITLGTIERLVGSTTAENLGVNLQESKQIATRLQDTVVNQQLQEHCDQRRECLSCGRLRPIKDFRCRLLDTVPGTVRLRVPRYRHCKCGCDTQVCNPISEVLSGRVTPELRHLQVSLGAQLSYRKAADLLRMLLPPVGGTTHTTTRGRLIAVGERIDEDIRQEVAENRQPDKAAEQMIIGIDRAFVKGRPPTDRANLEIITGRIEADAEPSKVFAVVRDQDGHAKQHVQALLRQRGRDIETKLRVVSDGEDGMRSLVGTLFNANEQHILDWYHIARRFEAIGKGLVYLPHVEDFEHRLSRHWHHLNRAKWKVWHGDLYGASIALSSFYDGVDIHVMTAEADFGRSSVDQVRARLAELWSYLTANQTRLINYGREYREGHRISTARVESTVDQLVDCDGEEAAYALDPTRRADVAPRALCANQRRTGQIHPVVALRIIAGAGGGGMTPRFFPVSI
jgi:hypothetical protein